VLPPLAGLPIRVEIRKSLGPHLAATSIPRRLILLDSQTLRERGEFERILVHEIFHFAWLRLSNQSRWSWEAILRSELNSGAKGELGWSAEWRKRKLTRTDRDRRTPAWRRYACESFCDSAASTYSDLRDHEEFTLAQRFRRNRANWFARNLPQPIPI
jgi:hypothetical protein